MSALSSGHLEAFFVLAQTGSFTRAARELHITQSALSQRILNLESELETTLLIRDRAGQRLTEVGQKLLRFCQTKNDLEADFLASFKSADPSGSELSGIVRIGGFSSVMRSVVVPVLSPLLRKNPKVQLQILTREMDELLPLLKRGEVDFVVSDQRFDREEIESLSLGHECNVLVEAGGYKGGNCFLDHDANDMVTLNYLKKFAKGSQKIQRHLLDDVYGLIDGVRAGLGRAVLPKHLIEQESGLRILQPTKSLDVEVFLGHFVQPYYSRLHQRIVDELVNGARSVLKKR